jgi:hypothetical protein
VPVHLTVIAIHRNRDGGLRIQLDGRIGRRAAFGANGNSEVAYSVSEAPIDALQEN